MKRIIIHWTGGTNQPSSTDFEHYHYLITGDGLIIEGKYKPENNLDCTGNSYAAHTGGGNTGSIGLAVCGMANFKSNDKNSTKYPLTKKQFEKLFLVASKLIKKYNLKLSHETVMTHAEFGLKHQNTSSKGKIDINYLHPYDITGIKECGRFIRSKIKWYLTNS